MKVFIVLFSVFVACVLANGYGGESYSNHYAPIVTQTKYINSGNSWQYRKQDGWGNYAFGYDEQHHDAWGSGGSSRDEKGDSWGNKEGSYSLNVGDGRQRVVKYVADGAGFRASIKTNEPGIVASNPADANINTPHGQSYQAVSHASPVITHVGGYSSGNGYEGASAGSSYGGAY